MTSTAVARDSQRPGVPLERLVRVELRKMFDTRSGFWLMTSIAIVALLATLGVALLAPAKDLDFKLFVETVGFPMTVILPIMAILSVTGEWSQRTGLTTFTLAPHRGQVLLAKASAALIAGVASLLLALTIGALGNACGSALNGADAVWNVPVGDALLILLSHLIGLMVGFMLGVLFRSSAGANVAYFVYGFVIPTIFAVLAGAQDWFNDLRPWIDLNYAQTTLFDPPLSGSEWGALVVSSMVWLALPLLVGVRVVLRGELK